MHSVSRSMLYATQHERDTVKHRTFISNSSSSRTNSSACLACCQHEHRSKIGEQAATVGSLQLHTQQDTHELHIQ
jgi:hypothetical protein